MTRRALSWAAPVSTSSAAPTPSRSLTWYATPPRKRATAPAETKRSFTATRPVERVMESACSTCQFWSRKAPYPAEATSRLPNGNAAWMSGKRTVLPVVCTSPAVAS